MNIFEKCVPKKFVPIRVLSIVEKQEREDIGMWIRRVYKPEPRSEGSACIGVF
jgi:hypothetical protein